MKRTRHVKELLAFVLLVALASMAGAEEVVIRGATIHPVTSEPVVGNVLITDGRITSYGADVAVPEGARVIEAEGLHVYPGLFDAYSRLGLVEISSISATLDADEMGDTPHLRAATAIHPASEAIPVTRANGITHTVVAPVGALWPGQAALVDLDGWTVEEMTHAPALAQVIEWPELQTSGFDFRTFTRIDRSYKEAEEKYEEGRKQLDEWVDNALHYMKATEASGNERVARDLRLESLIPILKGEQKVLVVAQSARAIRDAVAWSEERGLDIVLVGGRDAYKEKELLAEKGIGVILGGTQQTPELADDSYDQPYSAPAELYEAGVKIAFGTGSASDSRMLPYEAGTAVGFGLDRDAAIRAITINAAELLGWGEHLGSIEEGKLANLIVTDGDPLEIQTQIRHVLIGGVESDTQNRHRRFYEQYRSRPRGE